MRGTLDIIILIAACSGLLLLAVMTDRLVPSPDPERIHLKPPALEWRDRFYGVTAPEPEVLWLVGNWGKIVRSDDAGRSWTVQHAPVEVQLQDIGAWDSHRAVAVGDDLTLLVTQDGGAAWRKIELSGETAAKLLRVKIVGTRSAWAVGSLGSIFKTNDQGANWDRVGKEIDVAFNDIAFPDESTALVVGEFGWILRSRDEGLTWEELPRVSQRSLMAVSFRNALQGVAVGLDGQGLVTRDGGVTWSPIHLGTREHLFSVSFIDGSWIVVGDMGLVATADAEAETWHTRRLADHEIAWHTSVSPYSGGLFVVGATSGSFKDGSWTPVVLR